jgi:peptidoglycan/LPS O-acetylase OafA/YrhL
MQNMPQASEKTAPLLKLECLRGFLALYVIFHHAMQRHIHTHHFNLNYFFKFGQEAVILFFSFLDLSSIILTKKQKTSPSGAF